LGHSRRQPAILVSNIPSSDYACQSEQVREPLDSPEHSTGPCRKALTGADLGGGRPNNNSSEHEVRHALCGPKQPAWARRQAATG
jgi:hypothetical protein